jgi:hypothetical protein
VTVAAQIAVSYRSSRRSAIVRSFTTSIPQDGLDARGFVAAASIAVGRLADAAANMLQGA